MSSETPRTGTRRRASARSIRQAPRSTFPSPSRLASLAIGMAPLADRVAHGLAIREKSVTRNPRGDVSSELIRASVPRRRRARPAPSAAEGSRHRRGRRRRGRPQRPVVRPARQVMEVVDVSCQLLLRQASAAVRPDKGRRWSAPPRSLARPRVRACRCRSRRRRAETRPARTAMTVGRTNSISVPIASRMRSSVGPTLRNDIRNCPFTAVARNTSAATSRYATRKASPTIGDRNPDSAMPPTSNVMPTMSSTWST